MTDGLRVLQVVASTDRRGAEVFATDLGRALAASGDEVETVALALGAVGGLDVPSLGRRALAPPTLRALRRRAREVDVVVAHGSTTLPACAIGLAGAHTPFVYRNIGDPSHWAATRLRRARVRLELRRAAAVVAIAPAARDQLVDRYGVAPDRVDVIPTAVDAAHFSVPSEAERAAARVRFGLPAGAPVLVSVGALSPEKDVGAAIRLVAAIAGAHLLVAGDGPQRAALDRRAAEVAPSRVHFVGVLADPRDAYAAADVVVLTSATEGLPAVLIEAGCCGVPVVTTDVGFVREIVRDGETGIVVTRGDDVALVEGVRWALANGATAAPLARAHCTQHFTLAPVAARWHALLRRCVSL